MSAPVAVVTGVGPGTGTSIVEQLAAAGYRVAMLARSEERLGALAARVTGVHAYPVDVTDTAALTATCERIERELGSPEVLVHNAVGGAFGTFLDVDPAVLEANFQVNVMALMHLARRFAPAMVAAGKGSIVVTGNTSAQRGKAHFAGFAPTKAAQRILAESIARELSPKGVHVAYLVIDAVIDVPWARKLHADKPDDFFIQPDAIAGEVLHLIHQPRSAWSFLAEIRPFGESW
tara:strand:- start:489 stop:1190 length:702 start_codon:yes stop_codon:yes gene_type:complete